MPQPFSSLRGSLPLQHPLVVSIRRAQRPARWLLAAGFCVSAAGHAADAPKVAAAIAAAPAGGAVSAATTAVVPPTGKQLEEIEVNATGLTNAQTQAPTQSDLGAMQPQSVIGLDYISNQTSPMADYASIADIAPGVANVSPAGPGLGESKQMTIRGFSDSQYNVTYDGIPFGDTNDFSHHTSSYFPAKMIGQIVVDRGPGGASQLGEATFGGTVALSSKDPLDRFLFIPTFSMGSYDTTLTHLELNSGRIDSLNGAKFIASVQYNDTDTAQTLSPMRRKTGYVKYVQPVGERTVITFLSNYNDIWFNKPNKGSLTQAQIDTLGRDFGLNDIPTSVDYRGYNYQTKQTDLEYLGVASQLSEQWQLDNKLYTYAYANTSHESPYTGTKASKTAMGGYIKINNYRAWGDTFAVTRTDDHGALRLGGWYETTSNDRSSVAIDYSRGGQIDVKPGADVLTAYKYLMTDHLRTVQLFAEYAWQPLDQLTVTPGVKYLDVRRSIDTPRNQTTKLPLVYAESWNKPLGYLSANYRLASDWSIYAQAAQGFLAPNLNQFYVPDPSLNRTRPQQTMNYQFGTVYQTDRFNADADIYYIDYQNFPLTSTDPVTQDDIYTLAKGARLHGIEAEATYYIGSGLSAFVNGSLSNATFKRSGLDLPNVPNSTAAFGAIFERRGFFASVTEKFVGSQVVYNEDFNPDDVRSVTATSRSGGFWRAGLSLGYGQNLAGSFIKSYKLRLKVDNLLDEKQQVADSVKSGNTYYLVLPGRSWFASVSLAF